MDDFRFFRSRVFIITIAAQLIAPFLLSFGNWANIIQYLSGFGMAYAIWEYFHVHKPQIRSIEEQMLHLHKKTDLIHEKQDLLHQKQDQLSANQHKMSKQQRQLDEKADDIDEKQNVIHAKQDQLDEQLQTH